MADEVEEKQQAPTSEDVSGIIKNHLAVAMGVGLIPVPLVDLLGFIAVQLNMLRRLAKVYRIPFSRDRVKHLLASLAGGGVTLPLGGVVGSLIKAIPVIGQTTGVLAMPAAAGATTYALGKVFIQHFESGGTFLTFDPDKVKAYYAEMLKEGEAVAGGSES
ncbi:MAG: DUF697 domain-containing protein [Desulfobacterales bacterium]|nr:DUF697 domain-containing protein [Desulfobacterales bacterium]